MVPAVPADVVDTAGAGDALAAAMLDRLVDEVRGTGDELRISPGSAHSGGSQTISRARRAAVTALWAGRCSRRPMTSSPLA